MGELTVGNELADYYINLTGIIMVIVLVPMALKMMSFRVVKSSYSVDFPQRSGLKYKRWSEVRMAMLAVTGWTNIVFYYLTLDSTGSICALITALALCFCWPVIVSVTNFPGNSFICNSTGTDYCGSLYAEQYYQY